jgi:hypothetical protein
MIATLVKVSLMAGALLLSACSGVSNPDKMNFHGSALGKSFGEYGSGLLHDD